jgi:hypothetical protein
MAIILKEDKSLSFEVSYVKYIKVNDMMEFYCSLMSRNIQINEGSDDLMEVATIITPFTKTKELLSFKKISLLGKYLLTKYDENEVIFNDNFVDK